MTVTVNLSDGPGEAFEILGLEQEAEREPIRRTMEFMSKHPNQWIKTESLVSVAGLHLRGLYELMQRLEKANEHIKYQEGLGWMWVSVHVPYQYPSETVEEKVDDMVDVDIANGLTAAQLKKFDIKTLPKDGEEWGKTTRQCPFCKLWFGSQGVRAHMRTCDDNPKREKTYREKNPGRHKVTKPTVRKPRKPATKTTKTKVATKEVVAESALSLGRNVLVYMQDHKGEYVTIEMLRKEFPQDAGTKVVSVMNNLINRIPQLNRIGKGVYQFTGEVVDETTPAPAELLYDEVHVGDVGDTNIVRVDADQIVVVYEGRVYLGKAMR